jgi:ArsR family metal-binding transcriptional regulator
LDSDKIGIMAELVENYTVKIVEPGCAPGSGRYGLQIDLTTDISPIFPYLNAQIKDGSYDHANHILIWRDTDHAYALHPAQIKIARIEDTLKAGQIAGEIIRKINRVWRDRENITPCFTERKLPTVIDLFKLLPKTNCKRCGFQTCLAFADAVRNSGAKIEDCLLLSTPKYEENKIKLLSILPSG